MAVTSSPAFENDLAVGTDVLTIQRHFFASVCNNGTYIDEKYHFANHVQVSVWRYRVSGIDTHF